MIKHADGENSEIKVLLYDSQYSEPIQEGMITPSKSNITFTNLTQAKSYYVIAERMKPDTETSIVLEFSSKIWY